MYASPQKTSESASEKLKSNATPNNNPEQVPAYMNSMKIVPSPAFNFGGSSGTDLANNATPQPHQNQSPKALETSDKVASTVPKISSNMPSKDEQKPDFAVFQRNKSNSVPVPKEQVKTEPDMLSEKNQENSTQADSNNTPDRFGVPAGRNRGSSTKVNTEPSPLNSANKEKTTGSKPSLLESDCSGIPLNIQMLKQKFKTQESKAVRQEEDFKNMRPAGQPSSVEKSRVNLKQEEAKKETGKVDNNKMDMPLQNASKQAEGQSANWIYKKFTEAALVKKEEPPKKSSPNKRTIETSEDGKRHPEQTIKASSVKNYQGSIEMLQSLTSPSKTQSPGMQAEQPKRAARMPQDNMMQGHPHSQYAQIQGTRHGIQSPLINEMTSLNASQSEIIAPSRDPMNVSGLLDNSHLARMTNWAGNPHVDFSMQNWQAINPVEYQKKTLSIINFYEQHLNNFKGLIIQQTNVIEAQKVKITNLENLAKESTDKVKVFEEELYKQTMNHQRAYQELLQKYSETATQLSRSQSELEKALKKLGELSLHEAAPPAQEIIMSPPRTQDKGQDDLNNLYQEIFSIKKDLNTQREIMQEIRQSTPVKYEHENSNKREGTRRSVNSSTHEHVRNETDIVYPLVNSFERGNESGLKRSLASSSVPRLSQRRDTSNDNQYEDGEYRGRANKNAFRNRSPVPDNTPQVNISKQNSQGTRVKDLLNWHTPSKTRDQTSPNKPSIAVQVEPNSRLETENETDMHNLTCERTVINNNRSSSTDTYKQSRPYIFGLSSNQKPRENLEEIEKLQQLMRDLYHERKAVEDELLKIPENWKNLEHRRRKAKIEAELERLDEKMEEYKNKMRELTASPIKQRR